MPCGHASPPHVEAEPRDYNPPTYDSWREGGPTDIIFLVERLESLAASARKLPLTNNVVMDQAAVLELIDQLRAAVPPEVTQARRITEEAGRITERAREEGEAVIARAQEQAARMLEDRELVRMAKERAGEIIETATREAAEIRHGGDEYAAGVLIRLEGECIKALTSIKRGIDMLDERHRPPRLAPEDADGAMSIEVGQEALEPAAQP